MSCPICEHPKYGGNCSGEYGRIVRERHKCVETMDIPYAEEIIKAANDLQEKVNNE
jgi:hypothetical protein